MYKMDIFYENQHKGNSNSILYIFPESPFKYKLLLSADWSSDASFYTKSSQRESAMTGGWSDSGNVKWYLVSQ